ncbi:MAG: hypothetical protein KatS3mg126_0022 [Lysobacteraceae bacterium]|nr:MAG: hypothetical protein KatS3mg126_0022 [Xanthomonadaceae bacterium]
MGSDAVPMRGWIRSSLLVVLPLAAACQPSSSLSPAPAPGAGGSAAQAEAFRVPTRLGTMQVTTVVRGLAHPWGLAFLPEGGMLVTERPGRLRRVGPDGSVSAPIAGVPEVVAEGQGGLLDVASLARLRAGPMGLPQPCRAGRGRSCWDRRRPRPAGG